MRICDEGSGQRPPEFVSGHIYKHVPRNMYYLAAYCGGPYLVALRDGHWWSDGRISPFGKYGHEFTDVTDKVCLKVME